MNMNTTYHTDDHNTPANEPKIRLLDLLFGLVAILSLVALLFGTLVFVGCEPTMGERYVCPNGTTVAKTEFCTPTAPDSEQGPTTPSLLKQFEQPSSQSEQLPLAPADNSPSPSDDELIDEEPGDDFDDSDTLQDPLERGSPS